MRAEELAPRNRVTKTGDRNAAGCLALFALPFMAVGVAALCFALNDLWSWTQMSRWQSVPAELQSLDLTTGSTDNATTYRVRATYRYSFAGRSYAADRVAIDRMADNIGSFQHDLYASLRAAQAVGRVTAYVDPAQPSSATLNRDLRPLLLVFEAAFALVFGGVGVALVLGGKLGVRRLAEKRELESRYPDQPWRWRADWAAGEIRSSSRATAYGAAGFAAIWNVVAIPTGIFVWPEIERGHYAALVGLLFPIAGVGLAFWAARQWLRARRVKGATLRLQRVPIALGSRLRGTIRVDGTTDDAREFSIELSCVEKHRPRGRNGESSERIAWQNRWTVPREQCEVAPTYASVPLDLAIPLELPAATARDEPDEVVWLLDASAKCRGPDLWMRFELPVFAGERALDLAPPVEEAGARPDARALAELGIVYERSPDGRESWTFRRGQHTSAAVTVTAVAIAFGGAAIALWIGDAPRIFAVASGAFGGLFAWVATGLWFTEYRVTLGGGLLTLARRGIIGARAPVEIPLAWIRAIRARRGMQAGRRLYYDLSVETAEDSLTAARSIADYSVAAWLARYWQDEARRGRESGRQVAAALAPAPQVSAQPR
jgi:hypothetical protein